MPTEYQELVKAIKLIEEMADYLSFKGGANICTGSIFHQEMRALLDEYYEKRKTI